MTDRTYPPSILKALAAYAHHVYEMAYLGRWPQKAQAKPPELQAHNEVLILMHIAPLEVAWTDL